MLPTAIPSHPSPQPVWRRGWDGGRQVGTLQDSVPSTGVQAAAARPIRLPNLKGSCLDHPLHQGLLHPSRCLCSPSSAPAPKSKKPKMQAAGDMFPSDWSPPPVEFLKRRTVPADSGAPAQRLAGTAGPRGLRRLAHQLPEESKQEPQDPDPVRGLASLEEPFWSTAGTSPKAAAPRVDARTSVSWELPLGLLSLPPLFSHLSLVTPKPPLFGHSSSATPQLPSLGHFALTVPPWPHTPRHLSPPPGPSWLGAWAPKAGLHLSLYFCS